MKPLITKKPWHPFKELNYTAFFITLLLPPFILVPVHLFVKPSMLLAERFFPGTWWLEIALLTIYAVWLGQVMAKTGNIGKVRVKYWLFFSIIFFGQFILGLTVNSKFLMSGNLHLPIPALIIGAPIYRGEGFFMPLLLLSTLAIVGPGWCSHLCYIGAWDNASARHKKRPKKTITRKQTLILRYAMLALVVVAAALMNYFNVPITAAFVIALAFGLFGVFLMLYYSRRLGYMFHCTTYCPVGSLVTLLGKLYPLRVKIDQNTCTACNICSTECRYDALTPIDIKSGSAGWNCTLCGDCLSSCHASSIRFSFFGSRKNAWIIYISIVVALHAGFLALARL
ncbi:MAG: 4Fe-4S binding protein [Bacteroidales bacterium]|nr:4Fe-4S binding protein [Bacteroidales bacterium]